MAASILDGKLVATEIQANLKKAVRQRQETGQRKPALAVILVGTDSASLIYVNNKRKACEEIGYRSIAYDLPATTSQNELLAIIDNLNADPNIDGILVQLPLPAAINTSVVIERINPNKDVDGFHPYNIGRLAQGHPFLRPCTPYGIIKLLNYYNLSIEGKHVVVIGASNIVGRPMALECLMAKATVTICHSKTKDLKSCVQIADLLIIATGIRGIIDATWLNQDQILVDVGIHRQPDGKLCGDVNFQEASKKVAWITPVPGGIGPMTIATLLSNTLQAADNNP